jgi:hypothetical protein
MFEIVIPDEPEQRQHQQRQLNPIHKPDPAAEPDQQTASILLNNPAPRSDATDTIG